MYRSPDWTGTLGLGCFGLLWLAFFALMIGSVLWVYADSEKRGKAGCLWALIAWFTWPFGLLAYFLLRDREVRL